MSEITIIVPVYCMEKHLNRCIESILNQTYRDFELILIDDGSTDTSGVICDTYAETDNRVRVFHKQNGGVASAKNFGIERAEGDYLTFVDSDDFIEPFYLMVLVQANKSHDTDLIIGGVNYCDEIKFKKTSSLTLRQETIKRENFKYKVPDLLDERALNYHVAKLYRRTIIEKYSIRFTDFRETGADDTVFNFEYIKYARKIVVTSDNIYNYVIYNSSTSHKYANDKWARSKRLDSILTQISNEMGILTPQMSLSLDNRIILSAIWSANAIIKDSGYSPFRIIKQLKMIANDNRIAEAKANLQIHLPYPDILLLDNHYLKYYIERINIISKFKDRKSVV